MNLRDRIAPATLRDGPATKRGGRAARVAALDSSALLLYVRADEVDCLLDGGNLFRFLVGNLGLELLLEGHHELDGVKRIGAQVVDEGRFILDLRLVDAQLLGDDLLDPLFDIVHASPPPRGSKTD